MILKYLDGPHTMVCWGNKVKYFLFRPTGEVPDDFGKLMLENPKKVGRFELVTEVKHGQTEAPQNVAVLFVCDSCGRTAKSNAGLAAHKRKHNKEIKT